MSRITVTRSGVSTSPIVWVSMTPWSRAPITTHITIPGGDGIGRNYSKGRDNATTTLTGRCPWTTAGEQAYEALPGARVTVSNGNASRTGLVTSITPQDQSPAWIYFTMTVMED